MRVVLDTNVLFSGIFHSGPPAEILKDVLKNKYQIVLSEEIVSEYIEVLHRTSENKKYSTGIAMKIVNVMVSNGLMVEINQIPTPYCADPDDIKFLQTAIAGKAKFLISGDKHLLNVGSYTAGRVVKPREFLCLFN